MMKCSYRNIAWMGRWGGVLGLLLIAGAHSSQGQETATVAAPRVPGQEQGPAAVGPREDAQAAAYAESLSHAFRQASSRVLPTVVTIKTASSPKMMPGMDRGDNPFRGTPWEDLFERGSGPQAVPRREGLGSGVIIDPEGIILTNNHVVAESDRVLVELPDGREFLAKDIQTDPETDLAVLRIDAAERLPAAVLGDSDALQIGDWVLAVGSPFGLDATVSAGIISAKGRSLSAAERAQFLQTDAAINPGNSGGPLVNLRGEVVGINSAIASRTGAYQGIGFAVPANLAKWVSDQLVRDGRVRRSYLGVGVTVLTAELAEQMGANVGQGVVVMNVFPGSPAEKAGLRLGDIITMMEQTPITTPADLQQAVEKLSVGAQVRLAYLREGQAKSANVKLEELPELTARAERGMETPERRFQPKSQAEAAVGLDVQDLNAQVARELGYGDRSAGVLVVSVEPNSIAAEKGIIRGMLILRVGQAEVLDVDQFRQAMAKESLEKGILLLVATPAENRFVVLKKF